MTPIRKDFFRRLAFIGLGLVPIVLLWENKGPERFVALAGFLLAAFNVIIIVQSLQVIVDDFSPPKRHYETKTKPFDKFVYYSAAVLFGAGILLGILEIPRIDNTIDGASLFWIYSGVGVALAAVITMVLKKVSPSIFFESSRRLTVYFGLFLGLSLAVPFTASFTNGHFSATSTECREYTILRKSTGGKRNRSSWIFLKIDKEEERFDVTHEFWNRVQEGEAVILCTRRGKLGYEVVTNFRTITSNEKEKVIKGR
jgi:hypothetical protein